MTVPVAWTVISAAAAITMAAVITGTTMIAAMATMITATTDLDIDALSGSRGGWRANVEKTGSSQQSQFLDHGIPSCEICHDKSAAIQRFHLIQSAFEWLSLSLRAGRERRAATRVFTE